MSCAAKSVVQRESVDIAAYPREEALELCCQEALFSPVTCCVTTIGFRM